MPCTPLDFLSLAKKLSSEVGEIAWRGSISRAYYAAFHWADIHKSLCPEIHLDTVKGGMHEAVIQRYLRNTKSVKARQIGYILQDMRNKRESADYALDTAFIHNDGQQQILAAERFKRVLDEFISAENSLANPLANRGT